jgi:hypothetical protein
MFNRSLRTTKDTLCTSDPLSFTESLVSNTFLSRNHIKTFIFNGIFDFHRYCPIYLMPIHNIFVYGINWDIFKYLLGNKWYSILLVAISYFTDHFAQRNLIYNRNKGRLARPKLISARQSMYKSIFPNQQASFRSKQSFIGFHYLLRILL